MEHMISLKSKVGKLLKEARQKRGLTQLEALKIMEGTITQGRLSEYENGKYNMTLDTFEYLMRDVYKYEPDIRLKKLKE